MMKESVSTLMDNELDSHEVEQTVEAIQSDSSLKAAWREYHLIGEALRSHDASCFSMDIEKRVTEQLRTEVTVLAPHRLRVSRRRQVRVMGTVALVASLAWVVVVNWQQILPQDGITLSGSSAGQRVAASPSGLDNEETPYFLAHQDMALAGITKVSYSDGVVN